MSEDFDAQPSLTGDYLRVRPLRPADFDALYRVAADSQLWAQHPASDRHEAPVFRRFFDEGLRSRGALAVIDLESGELVGSSRYADYRRDLRTVEIGWTFLARRLWGGPYNLDLKRIMIRHAGQWAGAIVFRIGEGNLRSRRAAQKLGAALLSGPDDDGNVVMALRVSDFLDIHG